MADPSRTPQNALALQQAVDALEREPWRFDFYAAVHLFESLYPDKPALGRGKLPRQDVVRLGHDPSLSFANANVTRTFLGDGADKAVIYSRFLGLVGVNGPLPTHLTEYLLSRISNHDLTLANFLDLFHHRALSLFYRAWADAMPAAQAGRGQDDRFGNYLSALAGVNGESFRDRHTWRDNAKRHFAGLLGQQRKSAENLRRMLACQFSVPVDIEQFVGAWDAIEPAAVSKLGDANGFCVIGQSCVAGMRVWLAQGRFRVRVGPLRLRELIRYLPGNDDHRALIDAVRQYMGDEFVWDIQLVVRGDEIPATRLGRQGRLGMTSWLGGSRQQADNDEVVLRPDLNITNNKHGVRHERNI
jgi:type VI secretion system protein ImpH